MAAASPEVEHALLIACPVCVAEVGELCVMRRRHSPLPVHLTRAYDGNAVWLRQRKGQQT